MKATTNDKSTNNNQRPAAAQNVCKTNTSSQPFIQRKVFVNDQQVMPEDQRLGNPIERAFAQDHLMRDFSDMPEFQVYAKKPGSLDYLGNLNNPKDARYKDVWLRFDKDKTNVIGETHDMVTLSDCIEAVGGTTKFMRERFSSEELVKGSYLKKQYERVNKEEFKKMNIATEEKRSKYGLEPLEPKLGQAMSELNFALSSNVGYYDIQRKPDFATRLVYLLQLAWAHTKDVLKVYDDTFITIGSNSSLLDDIRDAYNSFYNLVMSDETMRKILEHFNQRYVPL